jgi:hypothetical protein
MHVTETIWGGLLLCAMVAACTNDDPTTASGATVGAGGEAHGGSGGQAQGGAGGAGGVACQSGLPQSAPACEACQDAHCCVSATAAANDPGTWTNSGAKICREANCFAECGVAEPECGGIQPSPSSCTANLYAKCCTEVTACAKSDECTAVIYLCIDDQGCAPGSACFQSCTAAYPAGLTLFNELDACFSTVACP